MVPPFYRIGVEGAAFILFVTGTVIGADTLLPVGVSIAGAMVAPFNRIGVEGAAFVLFVTGTVIGADTLLPVGASIAGAMVAPFDRIGVEGAAVLLFVSGTIIGADALLPVRASIAGAMVAPFDRIGIIVGNAVFRADKTPGGKGVVNAGMGEYKAVVRWDNLGAVVLEPIIGGSLAFLIRRSFLLDALVWM